MKFILILVFPVFLLAKMSALHIFPLKVNPSELSGITILDTRILTFEDDDFTEISALAFDAEQTLYALSDRGRLFTLKLVIEDEKFKLLTLINKYSLKTKKGKKLKKKHRDSEGMAFTKEGLIISFELKQKISLYDFKGKKLKNYKLPFPLIDRMNFQGRNKALESVLLHPKYGIITAPEAPLKDERKDLHSLFSLDKRWRFKKKGNITSLELLKDNNILVLERDFSLFRGHTISLTKVFINNCKDELCPFETLASLKSENGWELDNFEGLTHIKDDMYMMISDDNGNIFQKCIIILFKLN